MHAGRRYTFSQTVRWTRKYILIFLLADSIPVILYYFFDLKWLQLPWQPISLIGIAVAFFLGFKNTSSYDRLWEGRKIWGGIVNVSRSFTVMVRSWVISPEDENDELMDVKKQLVHRHVAWLHAMTLELRKVKKWEHNSAYEQEMRKLMDSDFREDKFERLKSYLSAEDYAHIMKKGNRSSHLLDLQTRHLARLYREGKIDKFHHIEMQELITEMYTLQGKSERIKNFPFPRQYASINYFFVVLFVVLLPFGMLNVFANLSYDWWVWFAIPFSVIGSWVFWVMELLGDYSENPFEGLYNDVPISSMAVGIEIDIRQMLDEEDLPAPITPKGGMELVV